MLGGNNNVTVYAGVNIFCSADHFGIGTAGLEPRRARCALGVARVDYSKRGSAMNACLKHFSSVLIVRRVGS